MSSNPTIYDNLQAHLKRGPGVPPAQPPPSMEVGALVPHESPASPMPGVESINMYNVNHKNEYGSTLSLHEPPYLLEENPHHSHSPYATHWGMSDTDLSTKRDNEMGFAEDEFDEMRQLHGQPIYPYQHGGSSGSLSDAGLLTDSQDGKFTWSNNALLHKKVTDRERGIGRQSHAYLTWFFSFAMVAVFIAELIMASKQTGQAVQTQPSVQPMIGPTSEFLISFGARFVPCMRKVPDLPTSNMLPCLQYSSSKLQTFTKDQLCSLAEICGLSDPENPNQGYRFVSAIVRPCTLTTSLYTQALSVRTTASDADIFFNLVVLLTLCCQIEKLVGTPIYAIVFMAGGIGGNLLGGNFGLIGQPSLGASGAVYTCISFELIDLVYNWKMRLFMSVLFAIIGLALGLLPGIDNFSHIGGFCVGLLSGMVFAPSIHATRSHMVVTWGYRVIGGCLLVAYFLALVLNFYRSENPVDTCHWCRYLSCLPNFDACKGTGIITTDSQGKPAARSLPF